MKCDVRDCDRSATVMVEHHFLLCDRHNVAHVVNGAAAASEATT